MWDFSHVSGVQILGIYGEQGWTVWIDKAKAGKRYLRYLVGMCIPLKDSAMPEYWSRVALIRVMNHELDLVTSLATLITSHCDNPRAPQGDLDIRVLPADAQVRPSLGLINLPMLFRWTRCISSDMFSQSLTYIEIFTPIKWSWGLTYRGQLAWRLQCNLDQKTTQDWNYNS